MGELFTVAPAMTAEAGDAWVTRVFVDPTDWADASERERGALWLLLRRTYTDSQGNSAVDRVEVWGEGRQGRLLGSLELFDPPRRSGPAGADAQQPKYRKGALTDG